MARKKRQEKKNNTILVLVIAILIGFIGAFSWTNRYDLFPSLVKNGVSVCFLTQNGNDKIVKYSYDESLKVSRFNYAIKKLIEGPSDIQKLFKTYSEIPEGTKIIAIIEGESKNIIDLTTEFDTGGGTESIYNKLNQLIKTVEENTDKPTYLFINGVQTEVFGGEGIMITQPLTRNSL